MTGPYRLPLLFLLLLPAPLLAQGAYEIQVYGSETAAPGTTMVELHSNTAFKGPPAGEESSMQSDEHAYHETLELTHGFTDWFETGFYVFTSAKNGEGWEWVGDHIRPRVRVPPSWQWPVGVSLSAEVGYLRQEFSPTEWDMEIRPIVDWKSGPFYASFNPALERGLTLYEGQGGSTEFIFAPNMKVSLDVTHLVTLGLEYYGSLGPVDDFNNIHAQEHQLFPVVDLHFSPNWEFNAGVGFGFTRSTDARVAKLILGYRFGG